MKTTALAVVVFIFCLQLVLSLRGIELSACDDRDLETHEVEYGRRENAS